MADDRELVARIVGRKDERAFRELYRRHTPALFATATRLRGSADAPADELVHDAWVRAAERLARFEWRSSLATWLTGILLNRIREAWRESARSGDDVATAADHAAPEIPLDDRIDLARAIALLPAGYRSVIVLHDVQGYPHQEIADLLGVDVGTSKSQLARARRALRRWLEPEGI
jgi:RNA polymerase sigma-70 factor (ECF subfamily)